MILPDPISFCAWSPWLISFTRWKFSFQTLWHLIEDGPIQVWPWLLTMEQKVFPAACLAATLLSYISLMPIQGQGLHCWRMDLEQGPHQRDSWPAMSEFSNLERPVSQPVAFLSTWKSQADGVTCPLDNKPRGKLNIGLSHECSARCLTLPSYSIVVKYFCQIFHNVSSSWFCLCRRTLYSKPICAHLLMLGVWSRSQYQTQF